MTHMSDTCCQQIDIELGLSSDNVKQLHLGPSGIFLCVSAPHREFGLRLVIHTSMFSALNM